MIWCSIEILNSKTFSAESILQDQNKISFYTQWPFINLISNSTSTDTIPNFKSLHFHLDIDV